MEGGSAGASEAGGSSDGARGAGACTSGEPVSADRLALLSEAVGFGAATTGGARGCVYHVTSLADSGPGTLRDAVGRVEPLWIVFDSPGDIVLSSDVTVQSDKTIDGRGQSVTLRAFGLLIEGPASNVIVENLSFVGGGSTSVIGDAIHIADGATRVWIDHTTMSSYHDGLIDVTRAATDITVSWSHFFNHDLVMLLGASIEDTADVNIRVTLHHNFWDGIGNYAPRLRFGRVHLFNNVIARWSEGAAASTMQGEIRSEANVFAPSDNVRAIRPTAGADATKGRVSSSQDLLLQGATVDANEADLVFAPSDYYSYRLEAATTTLRSAIEAGVGAR